MARRVCVALLLVVLGIYAGATLAGHAQQHERSQRLHREADPTKQSFADVERFRALFESSERDGWRLWTSTSARFRWVRPRRTS